MALNIKDAETDRLVRELARLSGVPITMAVRVAVEERLRVVRAQSQVAVEGLEAVIARGRARATLDTRPEEEILGYDDEGLPA